jgi:DNA-binding CsgD family transcriptional regulator/tetratricopeptide (TPR) repeat protein
VGQAPELLERAADLGVLADALEDVRASGEGRLVLLSGEAGVGKTTLLDAFCGSVRSATVFDGACDSLFTPRPLGPLLDVADATGGELAALVQAEAPPHEVASALMRELARRRPAVLVLEDVHWADGGTLDVLRLVGRRVRGVPVLVVASYRGTELAQDHPLRKVLGEFASGRASIRLRLSPLSAEAVAVLAAPHGADPDDLFRKTGGNPFFVVEALAAEADEIPETVRDAVLARAARLSPAARDLLDVVSVVPPHAELWLLDALGADNGDALDESLAAGMLRSEQDGVVFRHELARLAIEEAVSPKRKADLHRRALAALAEPPSGRPDLARLAHHADAAGDAEAVLRYAPAAAARASALGAHREAAAHYERALRFGAGLSQSERAEFLELRAHACYFTDQIEAAVAAGEEAIALRQATGDEKAEGYALRWLSEYNWCIGRVEQSNAIAGRAVELLERHPPGRELSFAYSKLASSDPRGNELSRRALEIAIEFDDPEAMITALLELGDFERALEIGREHGLVKMIGWTLSRRGMSRYFDRDYEGADAAIDESLRFTSEHGLELYRVYDQAFRARLDLAFGRWTEAADMAEAVLRQRRASTSPRVFAMVVLGLVRLRRGDPGWEPLLDEAWALAEPTEPFRVVPAAAARAEAAWLANDPAGVAAATEPVFAHRDGRTAFAVEIAAWRHRAGVDDHVPPGSPEPFASELRGDWASAAEGWRARGAPYEAALALAETDDENSLRVALDELQQLGAQPAAALVAGRLRRQGARGVPRGPRASTRKNPAGLTPREVEVLLLVADGLRDADIAKRLVLSERTVGHHVSAILRKLEVRTRAQAGAEAVRLGLADEDR